MKKKSLTPTGSLENKPMRRKRKGSNVFSDFQNLIRRNPGLTQADILQKLSTLYPNLTHSKVTTILNHFIKSETIVGISMVPKSATVMTTEPQLRYFNSQSLAEDCARIWDQRLIIPKHNSEKRQFQIASSFFTQSPNSIPSRKHWQLPRKSYYYQVASNLKSTLNSPSSLSLQKESNNSWNSFGESNGGSFSSTSLSQSSKMPMDTRLDEDTDETNSSHSIVDMKSIPDSVPMKTVSVVVGSSSSQQPSQSDSNSYVPGQNKHPSVITDALRYLHHQNQSSFLLNKLPILTSNNPDLLNPDNFTGFSTVSSSLDITSQLKHSVTPWTVAIENKRILNTNHSKKRNENNIHSSSNLDKDITDLEQLSKDITLPQDSINQFSNPCGISVSIHSSSETLDNIQSLHPLPCSSSLTSETYLPLKSSKERESLNQKLKNPLTTPSSNHFVDPTSPYEQYIALDQPLEPRNNSNTDPVWGTQWQKVDFQSIGKEVLPPSVPYSTSTSTLDSESDFSSRDSPETIPLPPYDHLSIRPLVGELPLVLSRHQLNGYETTDGF